MKITSLTEEQKENLFVTYNQKYCVFCKENFGFTFLEAFLDKRSLDEVVNRYHLKPKMDQGATMVYLSEAGAFKNDL